MENFTDPYQHPDPIDKQPVSKPPLHPGRLKDLYFAPSRFFAADNLDWAPYYRIAAWLIGISGAIDRIDKNLMRADLGDPRPGQEMMTESWFGFWSIVLLSGILGGYLIWLVGGWWYRVRLIWSGALQADKRAARLVYIYAALVGALPNLLIVVIASLLFENYAAYWASDEVWSSLLIIFPFWGIVVSYKGAMTTFEVRKGRAQWWFLWFPICLYIVFFGVVAAMYALL